jgi:hypothetical protein
MTNRKIADPGRLAGRVMLILTAALVKKLNSICPGAAS